MIRAVAGFLLRAFASASCIGLAFVISLSATVAFSSRPSLLEDIPYGAAVLSADGGIMRIGLAGDDKYRLRVGLDAVSPLLVRYVLEYEDRYFFSHPGINPVAVMRSAMTMLSGAGRQTGASTISMQVSRLKYRIDSSRIAGKLRQMWLALVLERHYSKQQILEAYFQLAPYGGNIEGAEAAARIYFDKPAGKLTRLEAMALAITPQNPGARNPFDGRDALRARRLLARADGESGLQPALQSRDPHKLPFLAPHLSLELLSASAGNASTGVDLELQALLERSIKDFTARGSALGINNACAMLVDTASMEVRALVGSSDFFSTDISGQVDGTRARRSPGSTLKPFIYAKALDEGLIHPLSILPDTPASFGGYDPENFDRGFRGPLTAASALAASRNLPAVRLAQRLAPPGLYGLLKSAHVGFPAGPEHYGLALALGGAEVSMRELAGLYAALRNEGLWRPLRMRREEPESGPVRLFSPEAAWLTLNMLRRDGSHARSGRHKIPVYYKTGTSNGFRDAWTAGIIGRYVLVVWVGDFANGANPHFVGAESALPLFMQLCHAIAGKRKLQPEAETPPASLNLVRTEICASTGDIFKGQCKAKTSAYLIPGVSPVKDSGILRPILVDRDTGLRACEPVAGKTMDIWWEFWPSDMTRIFEAAGVHKPAPPDFLPQCKGTSIRQGLAPRITMPQADTVYLAGKSLLSLQASADADVKVIHWYSKSLYLGSSRPGEIFSCPAPAGSHLEILAVDDHGRSARNQYEIINLFPGSIFCPEDR